MKVSYNVYQAKCVGDRWQLEESGLDDELVGSLLDDLDIAFTEKTKSKVALNPVQVIFVGSEHFGLDPAAAIRNPERDAFDQHFHILPEAKYPRNQMFLNKCVEIVEHHISDRKFNISMLAGELFLSTYTVYKKIKAYSGISPGELIRYTRLKNAARLLVTTDCYIKEAAYFSGFQDLKHFREQFSKIFKMSAQEFRNKYKNGVADMSLPTSLV